MSAIPPKPDRERHPGDGAQGTLKRSKEEDDLFPPRPFEDGQELLLDYDERENNYNISFGELLFASSSVGALPPEAARSPDYAEEDLKAVEQSDTGSDRSAAAAPSPVAPQRQKDVASDSGSTEVARQMEHVAMDIKYLRIQLDTLSAQVAAMTSKLSTLPDRSTVETDARWESINERLQKADEQSRVYTRDKWWLVCGALALLAGGVLWAFTNPETTMTILQAISATTSGDG